MQTVNALLFISLDSWAKPFAPYSTAVEDFWISEGRTIQIPIMSTVEMVHYGDFTGKGFRLIKKPMKVSTCIHVDIFPTVPLNAFVTRCKS